MSDCKIYPADAVDIYGNVWPTVGENIRNGMFGKLKVGKIEIDGTNITSSDFQIYNITDYNFTINKKPIFGFIDKVYKGIISIRFSYSLDRYLVISYSKFADIKADISILYME